MKLYSVIFSSPCVESREIVLEADSANDAKVLFSKLLTQNAYLKVPFNNTELLLVTNTIKIDKINLYKVAVCKK